MNSNNLTAILSVLTIATTLGYHRESRGSTELASRVEKLEEVCKQQDAVLMGLSWDGLQGKISREQALEAIDRLSKDELGAKGHHQNADQLRKWREETRNRYYDSAWENGLLDSIAQWDQRITREWSK